MAWNFNNSISQDIIAMQEIIWEIKPDLIIETGIALGGSLIFYASLLELIGHGQVLGIDIDIRDHNKKAIESHRMFKRISMIEGSSISDKIHEQVKKYAKGKQKILYRETGEVDLSDSPTPRFDLLELDKYRAVSLQFSRGCPYRCEFCDIIIMFGRKPRTKSLDQVGKELDLLRKILQLPEVVVEATQKLTPHLLPHYALDLAKVFTTFYRDCRVLSSDPADAELSRARLTLVRATKIALAHILDLMGMSAPESM